MASVPPVRSGSLVLTGGRRFGSMRSVSRQLLFVLLALAGLLTGCAGGGSAPHGLAPSAGTAAAGPRPLPRFLSGLTVDDVSDIKELISSERRLPFSPVTRLYLDASQPPSSYTVAIRSLWPVSYLMAELLDSSDETRLSVAEVRLRATEYVAAFGRSVDLWEIGNEVNGSWTGPYPAVSAKLTAAYRVVADARLPTALTLYYNEGCGDGPGELDPLAFSRQYIPPAVRQGLEYVFVSYYPDQCGYQRPSARTWTRFFGSLHTLYPRALVGFGEIGLASPVSARTLAYARSEIAYYYGLRIGLPYYVGGYFWWYYAEDRALLGKALASGFRAEAAAFRLTGAGLWHHEVP